MKMENGLHTIFGECTYNGGENMFEEVTKFITKLTDEFLSYGVFSVVLYLIVTGQAAFVPAWFIPIVVLIAEKYWNKKKTNGTIENETIENGGT